MLTHKRRALILELLRYEEMISLQRLVEALSSSESTIRRDLSQLEKEGLLVRIHGGAKRSYSLELEHSIQEKERQSKNEKHFIGKKAALFVEDGDTIFIDAGTTTLHMVKQLAGKQFTAVTNGIQQATALSELGVRVILIGGLLKNGTRAIIGSTAIEQLKQYHFDKTFLGMNGIDLRIGYTTTDEEEATIKRIAMRQSGFTYVLADATKLSKISFCQVAALNEAAMIINQPEKKYEEKLKEQTTVWIVPPDISTI